MALSSGRVVRWLLLAVAAFLVFAQFVPVDRSNPVSDPGRDIVAQLSPPAPVAAALERSCRDCHSNGTRWPWYSRVAPASWLVADDVHEARRKLNFSEWAGYDTQRAAERLNEICDEVKSGGMPMAKYTLLHRDAALTQQDVSAVCGWAKAERSRLLEPSR